MKALLTGIGILVLGILGFYALIALRAEAPKVEREIITPLVTTIAPEPRSGPLQVVGNGVVRPTREINLVAEVAGKIVAISPSAVSGGFFRKGDVVASIDPADYQNAVSIAEAEVTQRQYELLLAEEEVRIARQEWERMQSRAVTPAQADSSALGALVLKEPQRRLAEAQFRSAEARLADARTRLERTRITAPFNGRIRTKQVDLGQYIAPGQAVASFYSTDEVEIAVPLASSEAALVGDLWARDLDRSRQIPARVSASFGENTYTWEAYVDRTEGTLDAATRSVNVIVRVRNPYARPSAGQPPLLVGTFTTVEIAGDELSSYVVIPRAALREDDRVWVFDDGRLTLRDVGVIREYDGLVYIREGLTPADQLIDSSLDVVTDGMAVRAAGQQ